MDEQSTEIRTPFDRITFEPGKMGGRACIRGLRVTVGLIVSLVAEGVLWNEILADYPYLEREDIRQALAYACLADPRGDRPGVKPARCAFSST